MTDAQMSFEEMLVAADETVPVWTDADTNTVAQHLTDSGRATAIEHLTVSRFSLDEPAKRQARGSLDGRRNVALHVQWAAHRRNPRRALPPRADIPASMRAAVMEDALRRCGYCGADGNEVTLQLGHILSVADAHDLMWVLGDNEPWRLASTMSGAEDLFAQCTKCNLGQSTASLTEYHAGRIMMRPRGNRLPLRWEAVTRVVYWCGVVEDLNARRDPHCRAGRCPLAEVLAT